MACEPIPNCETCTGSTEALDCTRLRAMRCKLAAQLDAILCAPAGPVEIEGLRFESRSAAIESLTKAIDWTILRCSELEELQLNHRLLCNVAEGRLGGGVAGSMGRKQLTMFTAEAA